MFTGRKRYGMQKSWVALFITLLIVIPTTIVWGMIIHLRFYNHLSSLVMLEIFVPYLLVFVRKKTKNIELIKISVLAIMVSISRIAIPFQNFKPVFAIIMLIGISFGPETGFVVGALSAFCRGFIYGHGPFTIWQMIAYGIAGVLAGICFAEKRMPKKNWVMGVFCFVCTVMFIGPVLDTSTLSVMDVNFTWESILPIYLSGIPVNVSQGTAGFITMLLFGNAILKQLKKIDSKYGMKETEEYIA